MSTVMDRPDDGHRRKSIPQQRPAQRENPGASLQDYNGLVEAYMRGGHSRASAQAAATIYLAEMRK